jgi:hypothetical protein
MGGLYGMGVGVVKMRFRGSSRFVKYLNKLAVSLSGVVAIEIIPIAPVT